MIRSFDAEKGFGFIDCPESYGRFGRDVFIHKNQIGNLDVGMEVVFFIDVNKNGHPQARNTLKYDPTEAMAPVAPMAPMADARYFGRIKSLNPEKGYGFIDCPAAQSQFSRDVFIHKRQVGNLVVGAEVSFFIETNKDGHPQARDVEELPEEQVADSELRHVGRIKSFEPQKGYGFIDCPEAKERFGRDVFIHRREMGGLEVGSDVEFSIELNEKGQPQARDLHRLGEISEAGSEGVVSGEE